MYINTFNRKHPKLKKTHTIQSYSFTLLIQQNSPGLKCVDSRSSVILTNRAGYMTTYISMVYMHTKIPLFKTALQHIPLY